MRALNAPEALVPVYVVAEADILDRRRRIFCIKLRAPISVEFLEQYLESGLIKLPGYRNPRKYYIHVSSRREITPRRPEKSGQAWEPRANP